MEEASMRPPLGHTAASACLIHEKEDYSPTMRSYAPLDDYGAFTRAISMPVGPIFEANPLGLLPVTNYLI